jgi:hypothetical protein
VSATDRNGSTEANGAANRIVGASERQQGMLGPVLPRRSIGMATDPAMIEIK